LGCEAATRSSADVGDLKTNSPSLACDGSASGAEEAAAAGGNKSAFDSVVAETVFTRLGAVASGFCSATTGTDFG
jgi:hypothetical protein